MAMPVRGGIITYNIDSVEKLYSSYLPFVQNGGLFIPNKTPHKIGQDVFVAVTLPQSSERYPLNGKVVWINHKTVGARPAGFAVQFGTDPNGTRIKDEVEKMLAGKLDSLQPTYTM